MSDWSWKQPIAISKIYEAASPKKLKKKRQGKSKRQLVIEKLRKFYLARYKMHETASNAQLCNLIANELAMEMPGQKNQYIKFMKKARGIIGYQESPRRRTGVSKYQSSDDFYKSKAWRDIRYIALSNSNGCCCLCGARASDGVKIHVDHIIPRSINPKKELDLDNLQVLCEDCNFGKSNTDDINWRQHWESI